MPRRKNPFLALVLCGLVFLGSARDSLAQGGSGEFDPSDVYFQAWLSIKDAEKLESSGKAEKAYRKYLHARKLFETVSRYRPGWKPDIVRMRLESTAKSLENLQSKALAEQQKKERDSKGIIDGDIPAAPVVSRPPPLPPLPTAPSRKNEATGKRLAKLEKEISLHKGRLRNIANERNEAKAKLRLALANLRRQKAELQRLRKGNASLPPSARETGDSARLRRLQERIAEIECDLRETRNARDAEAAGKRRLLAELREARARLANAPVQAEINSLQKKLTRVTEERKALAIALGQSQEKLRRALATAAKLKSDHDLARGEQIRIQRSLGKERHASNAVIRGLRRQLKGKQNLLDKQSALLAQAHKHSDELSRQLAEAQAEITELKTERDSILKERDQMAHLLNIRETKRVQQMIGQNMALGRQLQKARETIKTLSSDSNAAKDKLIEARRDLAVAKIRVRELRTEQQSQTRRLADLRKKLEDADAQLALSETTPGLSETARLEIQTLKGIIKRHALAQDIRIQKRALLLAEVARLNNDNPGLLEAIHAFSEADVSLTDEETRLLVRKDADASLRFDSGRISSASRKRAAAALQINRRHMGTAAKRCYTSKRYRAARELYEMILDLSPGHIPTLLNLGTIHLKLRDYPKAGQAFEDAITLRAGQPLPYGHYMLGATYYEQGLHGKAIQEFRKTLVLHPENASAHIFLGNIAGLRKPGEARRHFIRATEIDPTLTEPHYNLSVLALHRGKKKEALRHYKTLIEKGGQQDLEFEKKLGTQMHLPRREPL